MRLLISSVLIASVLVTQRAGAEPPQPFIGSIFPAGARQGTTVEITATGRDLQAEAAVRVSGSGVTARVAKLLNPTSATVSVTVAADATPGLREMRVIGSGGASNRVRFAIGVAPETLEAEPNSERAQAQALASLPVVVNGQSMEGDRDYYRFAARAGQSIVCRAQARELQPFIADAVPGWNDAVLTLFDPAGQEVASGDDVNFAPDPVLDYRVPKDGEYLLEIRDVLFRGRADFVYRLTVSLDSKQGRTEAKQALSAVTSEAEPNDVAGDVVAVKIPTTISGRIDRPGDVDEFAVRGQAGQKLVAEVHARRLNSPLDASLAIFNAAGKKLAENDDTVDLAEPLLTHHADPRVLFTFPKEGRFVVRIRDVQGKGGEAYAYRLTLAEPRPDYELRVAPDNPRVAKGDSAALTVTAIRKDGFAGPIDLKVDGLPAGFVVSPAAIAAGQTAAVITVTAPDDARTDVLCPTVRGESKVGEGVLARTALPAEQVMQAFSYTHIMPTQELALAVVESAPLRITLDRKAGDVAEIPQGGSVDLRLKIVRGDGPRAGIALKGVGLPRGMTIRPGFIPPEKDEAVVSINVTKQVAAGFSQNAVITATSRSGKETVTRTLPAIAVKVVAAKDAAGKEKP